MKKIIIILLTFLCIGCRIVIDSQPEQMDVDYLYLCSNEKMLTMVTVLRCTGDTLYVRSLEGEFVVHGSYVAQVSNRNRIATGTTTNIVETEYPELEEEE